MITPSINILQKAPCTHSPMSRNERQENAEDLFVGRASKMLPQKPYTRQTYLSDIHVTQRDLTSLIHMTRHEHRNDDRVQNSITRRRSSASHKTRHHSKHSHANNHLLGAQNENHQNPALSARQLHSDRRRVHSTDLRIHRDPPAAPTDRRYHNTTNYASHATSSRPQILQPFNKTRRNSYADAVRCSGTSRSGACDATDTSQTSHNATSLLRRKRSNRNRSGHAKRNPPPIKSELDTHNSKFEFSTSIWMHDDDKTIWAPRRSIGRIRRSTHKPTPGEMKYPIHTKPVKPMNILKAKEEMLPSVRKRFELIYQYINQPNVFQNELHESDEPSISSMDIKELVRTGIIQQVSVEQETERPTKGVVKPFTTLEVRDDGPRRKFIVWPQAHNEAVKTLYEAQVPISQPYTYVPRISHSGAIKRDLMCGFYQVPLSYEARAFYRFKYRGMVYEMARLPMGHACAPELQHILTAVLAGHPDYARNSYPQKGDIDIYLDGFRWSGATCQRDEYETWVENRAKKLDMTFKPSDSVNGTAYDFLGVSYNHKDKLFRLSQRFVKKLPKDMPVKLPFHELETLTARLIYASSILNIHLSRFYWAIKFARRQIARANKQFICDSSTIFLPSCVIEQFRTWLQLVVSNPWTLFTAPRQGKRATLYTDASLSGWGAVLMLPSGAVYATGAAWPRKMEINEGETQAVEHALRQFQQHWSNIAAIDLRVDNTSAAAALRKKWSDSESISRVLARIMKYAEYYKLKITPSYVRSAENLADKWSRIYAA